MSNTLHERMNSMLGRECAMHKIGEQTSQWTSGCAAHAAIGKKQYRVGREKAHEAE